MGNLLTGEKLLADDSNEFQQEILKEYDKAIAVDMGELRSCASCLCGARFGELQHSIRSSQGSQRSGGCC